MAKFYGVNSNEISPNNIEEMKEGHKTEVKRILPKEIDPL